VVRSCLSLPCLFSSDIQFVRQLWFSVVPWMCLERNHFWIPTKYLSSGLLLATCSPSYAVASSMLIFGPLFLCLYYKFHCLSLLHFLNVKILCSESYCFGCYWMLVQRLVLTQYAHYFLCFVLSVFLFVSWVFNNMEHKYDQHFNFMQSNF